jgi:hypothetical protein
MVILNEENIMKEKIAGFLAFLLSSSLLALSISKAINQSTTIDPEVSVVVIAVLGTISVIGFTFGVYKVVQNYEN